MRSSNDEPAWISCHLSARLSQRLRRSVPAADTEPLIENLPGFPDNLSAGLGGRFWLALISPRNKLLDRLSGAPFARTMIQRLPTFVRPQAVAYGHLVAIDGTGKVLASLQDPDGAYRLTTGATESRDYIYVGSLVMPSLGRLPKAKVGL